MSWRIFDYIVFSITNFLVIEDGTQPIFYEPDNAAFHSRIHFRIWITDKSNEFFMSKGIPITS